MIDNSRPVRVFYDGKCGLCRREINYYKRIAPPGVFAFIDITQDSKLFSSLGYSVLSGLKALHVQTPDERMHIGIHAFIEIWKQLRGWRYLGWFVSIPGIKQLAGFLYKHFAAWRFKRLGYDHCDFQ